jgi:hypothetical protein
MTKNLIKALEVNSMFKGHAMTDFFDDGFKQTRTWLAGGSKGRAPYPDMELNDVERIDWWRGYDKAFEFCAELDKLEDVKVAMIEDLIIHVIYCGLALAGAYLISRFDMPATPIGIILFVYCVRKVFKK